MNRFVSKDTLEKGLNEIANFERRMLRATEHGTDFKSYTKFGVSVLVCLLFLSHDHVLHEHHTIMFYTKAS